MARYIAKNLVAAGLARRCLLQIAYAIGVAEPVSVMIDSQGTGIVDDARLEAAVRKVFRLTPSAIIETLELTRPIYRQTAAYGHFGRDDVEFSWERCDQGEALKSALV
jgi:S-adenosylmethionine synthetase